MLPVGLPREFSLATLLVHERAKHWTGWDPFMVASDHRILEALFERDDRARADGLAGLLMRVMLAWIQRAVFGARSSVEKQSAWPKATRLKDCGSKGCWSCGRSHKRADPLALPAGSATAIAVRLERLETGLSKLFDALDVVRGLVAAKVVVKEWYSTNEVAQILTRRPYTVREWCRLGRINATRTHSGRGEVEEWRISHQELQRIQNEGLLPLKPR